MRHVVRLSLVVIATLCLISPYPAHAQAASSTTVEVYAYGAIDAAGQARYKNATESASTFYQQAFGENPVATVKVHLFENEDLFKRGLIEIARLSEARADEVSKGFTGMQSSENILMNYGRAVRNRIVPELFVGHELMHRWQSAWTRGGRAPQWLYEGMADLWAARFAGTVINRPASRSIENAIRQVRDNWNTASAISLMQLEAFEQFTRVSVATGYVTYNLALLAYELLETRSSSRAAIDYMKNLSQPNAFQAAFGMSPEEFDAQFKQHLQSNVNL